MPRYKCKECQTDVFHDRSGIEAHMERHPKLTLESYSEKYETAVEQKAEKKGKETASEKVPVTVQMKAEVVEKSTDSDPMDKKVKVNPSSPAKSIMSNSSSNPGMIKVRE